MHIRGNQMYSSVDYYDSSSPLTCYDQTVEVNYPFKPHLEREQVYVRGSCNGLLCLETHRLADKRLRVDFTGKLISLWNPTTNEYKDIPEPSPQYDGLGYCVDLDPCFDPKNFDDSFQNITYGLGYDCKIQDYRLVRVATGGAYIDCESDERIYFGCKVKVFTLGSNSWKHIPSIFPYEIGPYANVGSYGGVLVNGALHWRATPWIRGIRASNKVVVSFDLEKETFVDVSPLEHLGNKLIIIVGNLGERLCIFGERSACIDVWVMKDHGVWESWTKLFTIARQLLRPYSSNRLTLIRSFKNGEILLSIRLPERKRFEYALALYDPKLESVRTLKIHTGDIWSVSQTYVESLVSLNSTNLSHRALDKKKKNNIGFYYL